MICNTLGKNAAVDEPYCLMCVPKLPLVFHSIMRSLSWSCYSSRSTGVHLILITMAILSCFVNISWDVFSFNIKLLCVQKDLCFCCNMTWRKRSFFRRFCTLSKYYQDDWSRKYWSHAQRLCPKDGKGLCLQFSISDLKE